MQTRLLWITPNAENYITYCARVSNPANQDNEKIAHLLQYCVNHQHWSVFETANACFEIETSRVISAQILRHRSFSFQEFSQRYADPTELGFESIELRRQAEKNRQSSLDPIDPLIRGQILASKLVENALEDSRRKYKSLINAGISRETARMILPGATTTRMYMNGTIRSWIHYLDLRCAADTQKEHRQIALQIRNTLAVQLPVISQALGWHQP